MCGQVRAMFMRLVVLTREGDVHGEYNKNLSLCVCVCVCVCVSFFFYRLSFNIYESLLI